MDLGNLITVDKNKKIPLLHCTSCTPHSSGVDFWTDPRLALGRGAENLTFLVEPGSNKAVRAVLDNANINYEVMYLNDNHNNTKYVSKLTINKRFPDKN